MKLESITPSDRKDKKMVAKFSDPKKTVHFGQAGSTTYLDDKNKERRAAYIARHKVNENFNSPTTPGALASWILWGKSTSMKKNIADFKKHFNL